ncbi:hypothetical protein [Exiguobacterium sp. s163]|uniref:hypothetical protein n=1 Tax=Exiguobacterium sp. s163 TaxID=2751287 RepID=UPI001BEC72A6|nr:hypothetical protein [Exiguobacterium sp. s163]
MDKGLYAIQQQQLQRTYGELRALLALHFDPMNPRDDGYNRLEEIIEGTINDLGDELG